MRIVLYTLLTLALLGLVGAAAVVGLGLYNVSAKKGHFPGVPWVLHTTFRQSVKLRAPDASEVPELDDAMAALGARHFDAACTPCHAAPGREATSTMRHMLPEPPHITEAVSSWQPRHLGWIVHEGVKMSGMPAWPASRWDDVWPVVAFLSRVEDMAPRDYAQMTERPATPGGPPGSGYCAGCHGVDGVSGNPYIPRLDIQGADYLEQQLELYVQGVRDSGIMRHAATEVAPERFAALAAYFSGEADMETLAEERDEGAPASGAAGAAPQEGGGHPPAAASPAALTELARRGRDLAFAATNDPEVPACRACHGPEREADREGGAHFPEIAGQYRPFLAAQLRLWRDGPRGGGPRANLMRRAAAELEDDEIEALAAYYAGLPPEGGVAEAAPAR